MKCLPTSYGEARYALLAPLLLGIVAGFTVSSCGDSESYNGIASASHSMLIVVSPHPDDESIMAAGTMYRYAHEPGWSVEVVFLSSGDAAGIPGPCREPTEQEKKRKIIELREEEARRACSILGIEATHVHFLRYPDKQLVATSTFSGGRRHDSFTPEGTSAVEELTRFLPRLVPEGTRHVTIITTSLWDAHPDHRTAYWGARQAAQVVATEQRIRVQLLSAIVHDEFPRGPEWCCLGDIVWPNEGPFLDYFTLSDIPERPRPPIWDVLFNVGDLRTIRSASLSAHTSQVEGNAELCMILLWKPYYQRWMEKIEEAFYEEYFVP